MRKKPVKYICHQKECLIATKYGMIDVGKEHIIIMPNDYRYMKVRDGELIAWADEEDKPEIVYNFKKQQWQCRDGRRKVKNAS